MINKIATGVPRSGTHFLSTIMGWHHEAFYNLDYRRGAPHAPEVSWLAAPYVDPSETFVIHIVRNPMLVLASNIHRGWYNPANDWGVRAYQHVLSWNIYDFYIHWINLAASKTHTTVRLEDISHLGPRTNQFGYPKIRPIPEEYYPQIREISEEYGYRI